MRHASLTFISDEQEANLRKLAAYLFTLPAEYPDFEMSTYTNDEQRGYGGDLAYRAECGTAACAVGHGPSAGIEPKLGERWAEYSYRVFVNQKDWSHSPIAISTAWQWCFGSQWSRHDNTAHGAAKRILWMLGHGVPENADEQRYGKAPLCYLEMAVPA